MRLIVFIALFTSSFVFGQNTPAAMRLDSDVSEEVISIKSIKNVLERTIDYTKRNSKKVRNVSEKSVYKKKGPRPKKIRKGPFDAAAAGILIFSFLGWLVMLGAVVTGIILWFTIGWWAVLIALGGIIVGWGISMISAAFVDGDTFMVTMFLLIHSYVAAFVGGLWLIWVAILGISALFN